jgi:hypothetical protein
MPLGDLVALAVVPRDFAMVDRQVLVAPSKSAIG